MQFKEGDKVLFLNEKGGGIVTKIVNDEIVHVSIEDGFEIPYVVGDLIKTSHGDVDHQGREIYHKAEIVTSDPKRGVLKIPAHQVEEIPAGLYMAFVPRDQDHVLTSAMDVYLLNHTPYSVSFCFFMNKGGVYMGMEHELLEPSARFLLGKAERTEIEDWNYSLLQALFFKKGKTSVIDPVSLHVRFKPVKIYKEESFVFSPLLHQKTMLVEIYTNG